MSGIRVSWLPIECTEKDIKIHFSKRENGGGRIQSIYYPMFNGDAVVLFENRDTADQVVSVRDQMFNGRISVGVTMLPALQAFPTLDAKLDPTVAALLQSEDKIREEIQYQFYNENVEFIRDSDDSIVGIRGNWYLLEWTWAYIDNFIKRRYGNAMDKHRTMDISSRYGNATDKHHPMNTRTKSQTHDYDEEMETDEPIISLPSGASKKDTKTLLSDPTRQETSPEPTRQKKGPDPTSQKKGPEPTRQKKGSEPTELRKSPEPAGQTKDPDQTRQKKGPESTKQKKGAKKFDDEDEETAGDLKSSDDEHATDTDIVIKGDKEDVCSLEFMIGSLNVGVFIGWITKAETDAIVNAAMGTLNHAGGVAYAIAKAASPEMQHQCDDYVIKHGSLRDGEVMHTCAGGDLSNQVKYIIHAVGPIWMPRSEERCCAVLTRTFLNCLKHANDLLKINTVTMPLISSGIFGVPLEVCVQSFLNAIVLFGDECDTVSLREVHLVNNNEDNTAMTVLHLRNLISHGADQLIAEAKLLLSSESTITSYARRHYVEPRTSLLDEDNVTRHTSSTTSDYSSGSPLVRVSGQKLSTASSSIRKKVDAGESSTDESMRNFPSSEGASGFKSPSAATSVSRSSPGSSGSPGSGPPTTSYLYSTEGVSGLGSSSASRSTYGTTGHKYTSTERSPSYNTNSSTGARASGSSSTAGSAYRSTTSQPRSGDPRTSRTTGRPLPDTPTGVKYPSKRY